MSEQYTDIFGNNHICVKQLGHGGQGAVYRTQTPNLILKLCHPQEEIVDIDDFNRQFEYVRLLPIPKGLHITVPITTLEGAPGYVMTLLDDMNSLGDAFNDEPAEDFTTPWLEEIQDLPAADQFRRYIASGGRRRRLEIFYKCACIFAQLHGAGLVYCDINDDNIFVSTRLDYDEVWVIDADNLNWAKERARLGPVYTRGFGAPEVLNGKSNTFYSDCYSFAISLFSYLYDNHPFDGIAAKDEHGNYQEDLRNSGELPWIFDKDDDSNDAEGLPHENLISADMFALFQATFSNEGKYSPATRPSMPEWAWVLGKDLDNDVNCPHCGMDYDRSEHEVCPWCDFKVPVLEMSSFYKSKGTKQFWTYKHEIVVGKPLLIPLRLLRGVRTNEAEEVLFSAERVSIDKNEIKLGRFLREWSFYQDDTERELYGEALIPGDSWIRCEQGENKIWIEVKLDEAK